MINAVRPTAYRQRSPRGVRQGRAERVSVDGVRAYPLSNPAGGKRACPKESFVKLAGLLTAALDDRALTAARTLATDPTADQVDITAPVSMRPVVAAMLAAEAERGGAGRPVLAVT